MANELYVYTYMGSKLRMVNEIEYLSPLDARHLYEVCGGFGAFIINNHRLYERAVYNELNKDVFNLMHVIKHQRIKYVTELLSKQSVETRFKEYREIHEKGYDGVDEVESAVMYSYLQMNSYNGNRISYIQKNRSLSWAVNLKRRLKRVASELQNIDLWDRDCFEILVERKDDKEAFIYMDVPYPIGKDTERITKGIYEKFDWTDQMHERAVDLLREMDGREGCKVMVCTYQSDIYDKLLDNGYWRRVKIKDVPSPAGLKGRKRKRKIECVYLNYSNFSPLAKYHFDIEE